MRADYDSEANTLEIELERSEALSGSDDTTHPRAIVHLFDGRPVVLDILNATDGLDAPLTAVARAHGLDREALLAAGRSALAAPDRSVELSVAART